MLLLEKRIVLGHNLNFKSSVSFTRTLYQFKGVIIFLVLNVLFLMPSIIVE